MNQPRIEIRFERSDRKFFPGEVLVAQYEIGMPSGMTPKAIESSVLWTTSGKGEDDFGVHFFERRSAPNLSADSLAKPYRISTVLPGSPLSYLGEIVHIHWCVRIRLFAAGEQFNQEVPFQLGGTLPPSQWQSNPTGDNESDDSD